MRLAAQFASVSSAVSVDEFARRCRALSGHPFPLDALRLLTQEDGFAARLQARILPAILRCSGTLPAAGEPVLAPHKAGRPARTVLPRAEAAGWLALLFTGALLVGLIVSPRIRDDEAIVLRGAARFARTIGYERSLRYGTPDVELVAIDAMDYRRRDAATQFTEAAILRELGKARCGFRRDARLLPVATGNWGCRVFLGDLPLKAVLQWLAASAEGRATRYFSFGDASVGALASFAAAAGVRFGSVGALYQRLRAADGAGGAKLHQRLLGGSGFVERGGQRRVPA